MEFEGKNSKRKIFHDTATSKNITWNLGKKTQNNGVSCRIPMEIMWKGEVAGRWRDRENSSIM